MAKDRDGGAGGEAGADEVRALRAEVDRLRKILARVDHEEILKRIPKAREAFADDIPGRVIALASVGIFSHEMRAELGISRELWKDWSVQIPAFASAVARARDLSLAYWHRIAREAVASKDWKMPLGNLIRMVDELHQDDAEDARGDASRLVIYAPGAVQ